MDYKNDLHSDDDFDCSNGFSDQSNYNGQSGYINTSGMSKAELRKTNKPIMEKRRRARINHCLNELKSLILEAMKKDPARHTKLEKADILEMTVKHLQSVQRQQLNMAIQSDPSVVHKFKTGFVECAEEVKRYIGQLDGVDSGVRQRLANHLKNCATSLEQIGSMSNFNSGYRGQGHLIGGPATAAAAATATTPPSAGLFAAGLNHLAPGASGPLFPTLAAHDLNNNNNNNLNGNSGASNAAPIQMGGVQLIPSRLPSGEFALIMPNVASASQLLRGSNSFGSFAPWASVVPTPLPAALPAAVATAATAASDFGANLQRLSAFTKPTPQQPAPPNTTHTSGGGGGGGIIAAAATYHPLAATQLPGVATHSPPLSPISSSLSSHGDDSSIMHTSSECAGSRPATPPAGAAATTAASNNNNSSHMLHDFSGVFSTPPSSVDSSATLSTSSASLSSTATHRSAHLQQQQVSSTSGGEANALKRRAQHHHPTAAQASAAAADSSDSSDEPSAKKFAGSGAVTPPPPSAATAVRLVSSAVASEKWERESCEKEVCSSDRAALRQKAELLDERDSMWRPW